MRSSSRNHLGGLDVALRHLQQPPDHGACVARKGTEAQKRRYLPKFATGELRGGLGADRTRRRHRPAGHPHPCRPDGDGYRHQRHQDLDHQRHLRQCFALLVKTDPEAEPRHKGMSMFIARRAKASRVGEEAGKAWLQGHRQRRAGLRGLPGLRRPIWSAARGPRLPGRGGRAGTRPHQRRRARLRSCLGGADGQRAYAQISARPSASRSASIRRSSSSWRDGDAPAGRPPADLDAGRAYDSGERCDMEAGMAKYFASEAAVENSLEAMRIHGGYSYSKEYHIERYFRDAPLMCIGEGTNEMQRIIIAKQLVERNPA
jgi:alkylation response protein AidB-like acyl-CoA dehydrogenase